MRIKVFPIFHLLFQYSFSDQYTSDQFHSKMYYNHVLQPADGFLLVYSVTDSSSLEDVKYRYQNMLDWMV